jgi:XRE family aerobic/anaerobic benzoate catabolism transcriptional regulator
MGVDQVPEAAGENVHPEVGRRLRAARARVGMTRKQLAQASHTSERYLAHLEAGTGNPSLGVITGLAESLGIAVADLIPMGGELDQRRADVIGAVRRLAPDRLDALDLWLGEHASLGGAKASRIVLIGLRGAGKSSLGAEVAGSMGFPFFEISKEVERSYGGAIGTLIEFSGQGAVRRYESEVWEGIIAENDRAIIAAPGHIVADGALYSRVLETANSIWLQATPEDHMQRVIDQGDLRPMVANRGAMDDLRAILAARSTSYSLADLQLDTSKQDFESTAKLLESEIRTILRGG